MPSSAVYLGSKHCWDTAMRKRLQHMQLYQMSSETSWSVCSYTPQETNKRKNFSFILTTVLTTGSVMTIDAPVILYALFFTVIAIILASSLLAKKSPPKKEGHEETPDREEVTESREEITPAPVKSEEKIPRAPVKTEAVQQTPVQVKRVLSGAPFTEWNFLNRCSEYRLLHCVWRHQRCVFKTAWLVYSCLFT